MAEHPLADGPRIDVAVIGGGPAGLAAATALKEAGVGRVAVLEREVQAGGIPRHCGHPPFGMREFGRILRGPAYAARLVARAERAGVEIRTGTTVAEIRPGGRLLLSDAQGLFELPARRVILATGVRERSRAARLIGGARVQGVMNTGALQSLVYLKGRRPFRRPVILGSELVAFSAILTCRHAGIRPVAMIEPSARVIARWPSALLAPLAGVRLLRRTRLAEIHGERAVAAVSVIGPDGQRREIACDGVILSGDFTPEAGLARLGHLALDPGTGGPAVDQWGRCSDPRYFATGNLLRPVETAGRCWAEGRRCGHWVAHDLRHGLPRNGRTIAIETADPRLKYAMPQRICLPLEASEMPGMKAVQLRVRAPLSGTLIARSAGRVLWQRHISARPERRLSVPLDAFAQSADAAALLLQAKPGPAYAHEAEQC